MLTWVPQGRGKLERLFGTITTELLPSLPGHLAPGHARPATPPGLSLAGLDERLGRFVIDEHNRRMHSETKAVPVKRWAAGGWLPRMPESLDQLDLLLLTVARPRVVHRDGRFEGQRYLDLTRAAYVGEPVTIRYDPRDLGEICVFHRDTFLCRAVSPELAGQTITLKDLQAARTARRRALRSQLSDRRERVDHLVPRVPYPDLQLVAPTPAPAAPPPPRRRLRLYHEE